MYCQECGTDLGDGSAYCPECGTPVEGSGGSVAGSTGHGDGEGRQAIPDSQGRTGSSADERGRGGTTSGVDPGDDDPDDSGDGDATLQWSPPGADPPADRVEDPRRARLPYPETTPPLLRGALAGVATYAVGYLCVAGAMAGVGALDPRSALAQLPLHSAEVPGAGWLFANAHNVAVVDPSATGGATSANLIESASASVPLAALYLVPPLVLGLGGAAFARRILARRRDERGWVTPKAGAVVGATLTTGYAVAAAVGALVAFSGAGAAPDPVTAVVVMGVAYPLAFATLGGALVGAAMGV